MTLRTFHYRPHRTLQPYIDRFWGWESGGNETVALPTVLPGTGAEFFIHYGTPFHYITAAQAERSLGPAHLLCVRQKPLALASATHVGFIAVRFRAGAVHRFIGVPGADLLDSSLSAEDIWGTAGVALSHRICEASSTVERIDLLQSFLHKQLLDRNPDPLIETAVGWLYRNSAEISIEGVAQRLGIGRRQLERRFHSVTGQTPVEVRRASRFQKTIRALLLNPSAKTLDTALAHGYYDQAHFIRDFCTMVGISPQQWLQAARAKSHFYNTSWHAS